MALAKSPLTPQQVEQFVAFLRVFGLVVGVPLALLSDFPEPWMEATAWATLGLLVVVIVGMGIWGIRTDWRHAAMVHVGFVADVVLISGFVVSWAYLVPNVSWAVIFTLLADAAMRYGVRGAVLGYVLASGLFVVQTVVHDLTGAAIGLVGYLFILSTLFGLAGVLGIFSHIVQRQAETERQQALALANSLRWRELMIATASHEFRGSLTAIRLGAETLRAKRDRLGRAQVDTVLDEVTAQAKHLQRLVDELLSVAEAENGNIGIRARSGDVSETVGRALEAASRHRRGQVLDVSVESIVCELDHERLQQVVRNLVENAYKYIPGGGWVGISVAVVDDRLELRVADNGPGIPPADRGRIFQPFWRRSGAPGRPDSAGLGLYVVKQIVDAMQGSLDLQTSAAGSTFIVRVPAEFRPSLRAVDRSAAGE